MPKRIVPLGQFKYGEISPQAAQSLSPKESPYCLRKAMNVNVDLLSGVKTRKGSQWLADIEIPNDPIWLGIDSFLLDDSVSGANYGVFVYIYDIYMISGVNNPTGLGSIYVHKKVGSDWVKIYKRTLTDRCHDRIISCDGDTFTFTDNKTIYVYKISGDTVSLYGAAFTPSITNLIIDSVRFSDDKVYCSFRKEVYGGLSASIYERIITYSLIDGVWTQLNVLKVPCNPEGTDSNGISDFSVSGDYLIVFHEYNITATGPVPRTVGGKYYATNAHYSMFKKTGTTWSLLKRVNLGVSSTTSFQYSGYTRYRFIKTVTISDGTFAMVYSDKDEGSAKTFVVYQTVEGVLTKNEDSILIGTEIARNISYSKVTNNLYTLDSDGKVTIYTNISTDLTSEVIYGPPIAEGSYTDQYVNGDSIGLFATLELIAYGSPGSINSYVTTGEIKQIAYKTPPQEISLYSIVHPETVSSSIYLVTSLLVTQIYKEADAPVLPDMSSALGITCLPSDYAQWGKYLIYIDRDKTNAFIADIGLGGEFISLSDFIQNSSVTDLSDLLPDWESENPVSLDYHEGRFVFVSKKKFYGAALEHKDSSLPTDTPKGTGNRWPFTFPGEDVLEVGTNVISPSTSFEFSPLGGDDTGFMWICSGRFLIAGSKSSVWILSDNSGNLSATAPNMHKLSSLGSANIKGVQAGGGSYYFQANYSTLMGLSVTQDGPIAIPINTASSHFFKEFKPVKMVLTSGDEATIWILREDGLVVSYQLNNQDLMNAEGSWSLHDFGGVVKDICPYSSPNDNSLVIAITREGNYGDTSFTCEKVTTENVFLDGFTFLETGESITCPWLKNREVHIFHELGSESVLSDDLGFIQFSGVLNNVYVGLAYDAYFEPRVFPDIHGKEKGRIISIAPIVEDTAGFLYGESLDHLLTKNIVDIGLFTGQVEELNLDVGKEYLPGFVIKAFPGSYMEINAIYVGVE